MAEVTIYLMTDFHNNDKQTMYITLLKKVLHLTKIYPNCAIILTAFQHPTLNYTLKI